MNSASFDNRLQHQPISHANVPNQEGGWHTECIGQHPTAQYKVDELSRYATMYGCNCLVETGLYLGHGSGMPIMSQFREYVVIDIQPANIEQVRRDNPNIVAILGNSEDVLPTLTLNHAPVLFWLDAHGIAQDHGFPRCPILREIEVIAGRWPRSIILIDDICMMGHSLIDSPTVSELNEWVDKFGIWNRETDNCIMRLTPKEQS